MPRSSSARSLWLGLPVSLALFLSGCGTEPITTTDITKPSVALTATPSTLSAAGSVTLTATASDNVGVSQVVFSRNGTVIATDTAAPYTYTDTLTSANNGTLTYTAQASDAAGNTATASQAVTVSIGTPGGGSNDSAVLSAATAFLATLSTAQQASVVLNRTQALAINWSNLPCGSGCRNGIVLSSLTAAQLAAARAVVSAAMGTSDDEGYEEAMQILAADDVLGAAGSGGGPGGPGGGYSSGNYYLAFLNAPSATGVWQLQFGGHHLAVNITYNNGAVVGATPLFEGVEPKCWSVTGTAVSANNCTAPGTSGATTTYAPLYQEQTGMAAMLASLSSSQLASAKLSQTFSDVLLGPKQDGKFPATKAGLKVGSLSTAQKALVLAAMKPWVQDADATTAAALLATYESELNDTSIAYSGHASLSTNADYVRIDGPSVWIEFVCQNGVVYSSQLHYHTVWRDHTRDYGASFSF
ncbi:DUF3500 domain-containing protein [Deinococcus humi]|uniref:DUF3500 domain-containing protein n=1 Tax=Deinococcus humi TaxID=662880 RepID=A0A7W8NER4_9DEIO|nr:DUF3500 domain-containing protein [Deinococcus humi]MBB5363601.1 hypothetical protein [Deinococcus humi]GGO30090.1 hypothetical protein GCM10008949_24470 [Deinococcus humi]